MSDVYDKKAFLCGKMVLNSHRQRNLDSNRNVDVAKFTSVDAKYSYGYAEAISYWERHQKINEKLPVMAEKSYRSNSKAKDSFSKAGNMLTLKLRGLFRAREKFTKGRNKWIAFMMRHPDVFKLKNFLAKRKEIHKNTFMFREEDTKRQMMVRHTAAVKPERRKHDANESIKYTMDNLIKSIKGKAKIKDITNNKNNLKSIDSSMIQKQKFGEIKTTLEESTRDYLLFNKKITMNLELIQQLAHMRQEKESNYSSSRSVN